MNFCKLIFVILSFTFLHWQCKPKPKFVGSGDVFRYNQPNAVTSLDPAFARNQTNTWATDHLYNGLVQLNDSLRPMAALARNWAVSADGLTYTFQLRTDVFFHENACFKNNKNTQNTRRLTASDVVYSFSRIIDTAINSPGSWIFVGKIAPTQAFSAPNDSTFILKLQRPFLPIWSSCCIQNGTQPQSTSAPRRVTRRTIAI